MLVVFVTMLPGLFALCITPELPNGEYRLNSNKASFYRTRVGASENVTMAVDQGNSSLLAHIKARLLNDKNNLEVNSNIAS
jgi:hypothetical protein